MTGKLLEMLLLTALISGVPSLMLSWAIIIAVRQTQRIPKWALWAMIGVFVVFVPLGVVAAMLWGELR